MELLVPFRNPAVLLALVLPALLLLWTWRGRGRGLVMPFDHSGERRGRLIHLAAGCAESLPALLLALVIIILAGPQRWAEPQTKKVLTNIEFCVDVSGSMTASFGSGTRYDASMRAINDFLDYRDGDAFGLTFFGNSVLHWVPLTTDVSAFRCAPPFMRPEIIPSWFGGTEIGKALLACRQVLRAREEGDRMILLISDGQSWDLDGGRGEEIAAKLMDDDITVYAVHIASSSPQDEIVDITSRTGGAVFSPGDVAGLDAVFQRIDEMQLTRIEKVASEAIDDYPPWILASLGVLAGSLLAAFGLRYSPW
ncbi:MAG: aerotolerance regulator BatA [Planctomycetes bacterium]|jgi:Ca-activated chloride channel family protein|nr:aerotolerance regulator BatA [Planctomycetota bacterium]HJO25841.1 vWA domain-containing protein [Planctomycetota bacterium]